MKSSIKYYLFLLFFISIKIYSQVNLDTQFELAKKLFEEENYFDAVTEFKRLLFFDSQKQFTYSANEYIGQSFKMGGKFSEAVIHFTLAEINAKDEEQLYNARIEIIRVNILRRTTSKAIRLLDSLEADQRFVKKKDEINYWRGWAYIFADEWDKASYAFSKTNSEHELKKLVDQVEQEKYSVTFAQIISYIFPGAGQIYTGHYISGLLSLGWNILWGYISINSFIEERIFDGLMVTNFLWLRFYMGNIQNAAKFAEEENRRISNSALRYLQNEYKGIKP